MAIIQISKIQNKRGLMDVDRTGLPNLAPGEFGYATNQQRLFIGNVISSGTVVGGELNTEILTQNSLGPTLNYNVATGKIDVVGSGEGEVTYNIDSSSPIPPLTGAYLRLVGSDGSNETVSLVRFAASGTIVINSTDPGTITIEGQGDDAGGPNKSVQYNSTGTFAGTSTFIFDSTSTVLTLGNTTLSGALLIDGSSATISTPISSEHIRILPGTETGALIVGSTASDSIISGGTNTSLTLRADNTLVLQTTKDKVIFSLPFTGTSKISIQGPSANDYASGLDTNDLVNKQYVDSRVSSATTSLIVGITASTGTVVSTSTPGSLTSPAISLSNTGVVAGTYTNATISVNAQGRITSASNGTPGGVTQIIAGSNITISSTGTTTGTGVVTINASGSATGTVRGPTTTTLYAIATFGNTTGTMLLNNSNAIIDTSGNVNATSFNATSTVRVKTEIEKLNEAYISKFNSLRPRQYYRTDINKHEFGFIAEEMLELYPEIVSRDGSGFASGIDYGKLSTILTAKIQEQQCEIDQLKTQLHQIFEILNASKH